MKIRKEILEALLSLRGDIAQIEADVQQLPWDSDADVVTLMRSDLVRVLKRYHAGKLSAEQVEAWANVIEGREDIDFEAGYEDDLMEVIYQLANPLLTRSLSDVFARELIEKFGA